MTNYLIPFITAIALSSIAAFYSVIGLAQIFPGSFWPIVIMGSVLEVAKLVTASWLYNNWKETQILMKTYFLVAIVLLMLITSMGIFGFLSKAHLDQVQPTSGNTIKINAIDNQIKRQEIVIDRAEKTLTQLDKSIEVYLNNEYATRGLKERQKQEAERNELNTAIKNASDEIAKLSTEKANLQLAQDKIEAEVGPIKYVAELIYGDDAKSHFDEAVRIVILILIFVFDPLAVLLLIAANISLRQWRLKRNLTKAKEEKKLEDKLQRLEKQSKELKKKDRDFRKLVERDLDSLDPDEIKLKLNQIYDWNDKK